MLYIYNDKFIKYNNKCFSGYNAPEPEQDYYNLLQGYYAIGRPKYSITWFPRTNKDTAGEQIVVGIGHWNNGTKRNIIHVKDYVDENGSLLFHGISELPIGSTRTNIGTCNKDNYLTNIAKVTDESKMYYFTLAGSVQDFSSNPFNGDWTRGDEGHVLPWKYESDDKGILFINLHTTGDIYAVRTVDYEKKSYSFFDMNTDFCQNLLNTQSKLPLTQRLNYTDANAKIHNGNILHCSKDNFGFWWK